MTLQRVRRRRPRRRGASPPAIHSHLEPPRTPRTASRPPIIATSEQVRGRVGRADQHRGEVALRGGEHRAQRRGQRGRGARGAERPVEPQRPREGPLVAPHQADDRGGDAHVEAEVGEVRRRGDGRIGLELQPGRDDHVAGRLREHREPEPDRRGPARPAHATRTRSTPPSGRPSRGCRPSRTASRSPRRRGAPGTRSAPPCSAASSTPTAGPRLRLRSISGGASASVCRLLK